MPAFQAQATLPDGTLAPWGDSPLAPAPVYPGTVAEYPASRGGSGVPPRARASAYTAGYAFGRNSWRPSDTTTWYGVRYGPRSAVHGHEDHTSVLWWARGRLLLTDTGHVGYEETWRRAHTREPSAHNVVVVDGVTARRSAAALTRRVRRPAGDFLEVVDRPYEGVRRRRGIAALHGFPALVVYDRVDMSQPRNVRALWHLPPDVDVQVRADGHAVATTRDGAVALHVVQSSLPGHAVPAGATNSVRGRRDPPLGWFAPRPHTWLPAPVVTTSRTGRGARMLTVLVAASPAAPPEVSVTPAAGGWLRVRITVDGRTRTVRVSPGGYLSL
jgi:hypothetical protein